MLDRLSDVLLAKPVEKSSSRSKKSDGHPCSYRVRPASGVTLLELLTVITIIGVLAGTAVPNFVNMIRSNRVISESNSLLSMITLARSEAIKRNQAVMLCKSSNGASCSSTADISWVGGFIIFADADSNKILDPSETIIRTESPVSRLDKVTFSGGNNLVYRADGTSSGGTFTLASGTAQKQVIVSLTGRPRIE